MGVNAVAMDCSSGRRGGYATKEVVCQVRNCRASGELLDKRPSALVDISSKDHLKRRKVIMGNEVATVEAINCK